ncbi:MAG: hypothetical protein F4052_00945 [Dehalococcoidia bacterium]|nr:hypothetical protein [Chloroflexota bacterium]MXY36468.1 hypothetical protein [Dehalococcoidia bacterium]MCY3603113.1 hypothetical protein [Chloroflexota bacterium]MCY3645387.1 hypothetical protein [Chloroflexota bacterium]MDE2669352.1 hypothetical protein [Chloroflexota bacterium]
MDSTDFYLAPMTMSYFFLEALEDNGYAFPKGWRSHQQNVEALLEDGKIVRINVDATNKVVVEDITAEVSSA